MSKDYKTAFLAIYRNRVSGDFVKFQWLSKEDGERANISSIFEKFNSSDNELSVELSTDRLVREICSYTERAKPLKDLIDSLLEVCDDLNEAGSNIRAHAFGIKELMKGGRDGS